MTPGDSQTRGFVWATWVVSLLLLFGLEARGFVYGDRAYLILAFVAVYVAVVFMIRFVTLRWQLRGRADLLPEVRDAVLARASARGIKRPIRVWRSRSTRKADAFVVDTLGQSHVVVSTLAQSWCGRPSLRDRFDVLIDHELGHVVNRDGSLLYLVRAMLWANLVGLGLKAAAVAALAAASTPAEVERFYAGLMPQSSEMEVIGLDGALAPITRPTYSPGQVAEVATGYTIAMLILFLVFYVRIVRLREFWADRFALDHAPDPARARAALEAVLSRAPSNHCRGMLAAVLGWLRAKASGIRPHSFLGGMRWHPRPEERLAALDADVTRVGGHGGVSVFLVLTTLILFRSVLGNSGTWNDYPAPLWPQYVISGAFILVCGYTVACLVHPVATLAIRERWAMSYVAVKQLAIWSAAAAAALWVFLVLSRDFRNHFSDPGGMQAARAYKAFFDLETYESGWLLASVPVVVLSFAIAYLVVRWVGARVGLCRRVSLPAAALSSCIAVGALWLLSFGGEADVDAHRESAAHTSVSANRDLPEEDKGGTGESLWLFELAKSEYRRTSYRFRFRPPLSVLLLWEGPYRAD